MVRKSDMDTDKSYVIMVGLVWLAWEFAVAWVSIAKGRPAGEGLLLTLALGPLGPLVAALMPTDR